MTHVVIVEWYYKRHEVSVHGAHRATATMNHSMKGSGKQTTRPQSHLGKSKSSREPPAAPHTSAPSPLQTRVLAAAVGQPCTDSFIISRDFILLPKSVGNQAPHPYPYPTATATTDLGWCAPWCGPQLV